MFLAIKVHYSRQPAWTRRTELAHIEAFSAISYTIAAHGLHTLTTLGKLIVSYYVTFY